MKRIFKIISYAFIICLIPFSQVAGQEKKSEHKIKIVIDDGSGTNIIIDTVLNVDTMNDSIKLKDGKIIFIGDEADLKQHEGNRQVLVTVSADGKDPKKVVKEITVVSSDSEAVKNAGDDHKIYVYSNSKAADGKTSMHQKELTCSDKDGKETEEKVIIIKDGKVMENEGDEIFEYRIITDNKE